MLGRAVRGEHTNTHGPAMYRKSDLNIAQEYIQLRVDLLQTLFKQVFMGKRYIMSCEHLVVVLNRTLNTLGYFGGYLVISLRAVIENDQAKKQECPLRAEG